MRLIDADALLEEMVGITDGWLKPPKDWKWYEDSVRNAPTVGGWISVKDRLPEQTPSLFSKFKDTDKWSTLEVKMIRKIIARWKHKRFCRRMGYYCPDCIYHDFVFEGAVFRGNRCRYGQKTQDGKNVKWE